MTPPSTVWLFHLLATVPADFYYYSPQGLFVTEIKVRRGTVTVR